MVDYWSQFKTVEDLHKEITSIKFGKVINTRSITVEEYKKLCGIQDE
jgi:hypothetical protein